MCRKTQRGKLLIINVMISSNYIIISQVHKTQVTNINVIFDMATFDIVTFVPLQQTEQLRKAFMDDNDYTLIVVCVCGWGGGEYQVDHAIH